MHNNVKGLIAGVLMAATVPAAVQATTLTGTLTVDNQFTVYISTDDSLTGTAFGSNGSWPSATTHSTSLTSGVTHYLHIFAEDAGGPEMLIGEFSLSDSLYAFANGTQSLLTNTTDWFANNTGFGDTYNALTDLGPDGTGPWGNFAAIDDSARFIWTAAGSSCGVNGNDCAYFSTPIRYVGDNSVAVSAPGTLALAGAALLALAGLRRKKAA